MKLAICRMLGEGVVSEFSSGEGKGKGKDEMEEEEEKDKRRMKMKMNCKITAKGCVPH